MTAQTAPAFPHRHLLGIEGLSRPDIESLLERADAAVALSRQVEKKRNVLRGRTQINLFFEPSPARNPRSNSRASGSAPT